ncbi:PbsX family transcriptional regulator [Streptomyces sp. N2-109]|uniref:PbsX family transcriptional regulator n=1 Tax=Streptomyces gossypii TaxID=2883101 RepID=A0ABT2JSY6_9ACTN|nr:penicillin-binding transpeptidase domain-containing protein [Streptomyces gossypii]MCT2590956.1 PbsX family transcriptional regulator [Streptomyces gossypii]
MTSETYPHPRPARRRGRTVLGITVALAAVVGGIVYVVNDSADANGAAADAFLEKWSQGDLQAAAEHTDDPTAALKGLTRYQTELRVGGFKADAGSPTGEGETRTTPFEAEVVLKDAGKWTYSSRVKLVEKDGEQLVHWEPAVLHPKAGAGDRLVRVTRLPERGQVETSDGKSLDGHAPSLVGVVGEPTEQGLSNAGLNGAEASEVGLSGLQYRHQKKLAGKPGTAIEVVSGDGDGPGKLVYQADGGGAKSVSTTIDLPTQKAAEGALADLEENAALVAIRPSTGEVVAVADNPPSGANRALTGRYPPGSDFKVVSTAALLQTGVAPEDPLACEKYESVNGQRFENQDTFTLPSGSTFADNFAQSCNTGLISLRDRLSNSALHDTAELFGIGATWDVGAATFDGQVPVNASENDKAASMIGQGRVQASPLVMASVAATVRSGTFRQPVVVPSAVKDRRPERALDSGIAEQLRDLMRKVVSEGSGQEALAGISGDLGAKTGTAEYGEEDPPRTHAWFIGFKDDLAYAIMAEDGGSGGADAGPVAAKFLKGLA